MLSPCDDCRPSVDPRAAADVDGAMQFVDIEATTREVDAAAVSVEAQESANLRLYERALTLQSDGAPLFPQLLALLAPSVWYEGWPLVAVEAMGMGTPVIATGHGAFLEMIVHGETGLLIPRGDAHALAAAVHDLLGDPSRLAEIRRKTAAEFTNRFSREVNYCQLRDIYADAIAQFTAG